MIYLVLLTIGLLLGNFVTTFIYRIPRQLSAAGFLQPQHRPICSTCHHPLRFYEYLPVLSWVSTRGRCNYCHAPINPIYFVAEVIGGMIPVALYVIHGLGEVYILYLAYSYIVLMACCLCVVEGGKVYWQTGVACAILGILYQILLTCSLSDTIIRLTLVAVVVMFIGRFLKPGLLSTSLLNNCWTIAAWSASPTCVAAILLLCLGYEHFGQQPSVFQLRGWQYHPVAAALATYALVVWI